MSIFKQSNKIYIFLKLFFVFIAFFLFTQSIQAAENLALFESGTTQTSINLDVRINYTPSNSAHFDRDVTVNLWDIANPTNSMQSQNISLTESNFHSGSVSFQNLSSNITYKAQATFFAPALLGGENIYSNIIGPINLTNNLQLTITVDESTQTPTNTKLIVSQIPSNFSSINLEVSSTTPGVNQIFTEQPTVQNGTAQHQFTSLESGVSYSVKVTTSDPGIYGQDNFTSPGSISWEIFESPQSGTMSTTPPISVTLSTPNNTKIRYDKTGSVEDVECSSNPSEWYTSGETYVSGTPIEITSFGVTTIKAVSCWSGSGGNTIVSPVQHFFYTITPSGLGAIFASPIATTYTSSQEITLSSPGSDNIHYTLGSDSVDAPTCSTGTTFDPLVKIPINTTRTIKAIACDSEGNTISTQNPKFYTFKYIINIPPSDEINTKTTYYPLAPLPDIGKTCTEKIDPGTGAKITTCIDTQRNKETNPCPFGNYLSIMIRLIIGIAAVLAMIMIVAGGIEYMTSELGSGKEAGKEKIRNAVLGLILALGAFAILNSLNPQLLNLCLNDIPEAKYEISPEQQTILTNRGGGGNCAVVTDTNSPCHPTKMQSKFTETTNSASPFDTTAAQASAICQLESAGKIDAPTPNGTGINSSGKRNTLDFCKVDGNVFSFGLFQINLLANGANIMGNNGQSCGGIFEVPGGGSYIVNNTSAPGGVEYNCKVKAGQEAKYATCKNYLLTEANNISYAHQMYLARTPKWKDWSAYDSCSSKF